MTSGVSIREIETLEELRACVALQEAVWGPGFGERVPVSILRAARRVGGLVAGAFDGGGAMVGFVFGMTGLEEGRPVHWSDMLAVRSGLRNGGVGTALKRFQRDKCVEWGVTRMYWTYDPLEARNGRVNLGKLGGLGREYVRNMYGPSHSPLHGGLATDRLVVLWPLDSPRVEGRLSGVDSPPAVEDVAGIPTAFPVAEDGPLPRPDGPGTPLPPGTARRVAVPANIQELRDAAPDLAVRWRRAVRAALEAGLADGLEVTELIRAPGPVSYLLVEPPEERT